MGYISHIVPLPLLLLLRRHLGLGGTLHVLSAPKPSDVLLWALEQIQGCLRLADGHWCRLLLVWLPVTSAWPIPLCSMADWALPLLVMDEHPEPVVIDPIQPLATPCWATLFCHNKPLQTHWLSAQPGRLWEQSGVPESVSIFWSSQTTQLLFFISQSYPTMHRGLLPKAQT